MHHEEGTEEGSCDRFVDEATNQYIHIQNDGSLLALPAPSAANQVGEQKEDEYDDVD